MIYKSILNFFPILFPYHTSDSINGLHNKNFEIAIGIILSIFVLGIFIWGIIYFIKSTKK